MRVVLRATPPEVGPLMAEVAGGVVRCLTFWPDGSDTLLPNGSDTLWPEGRGLESAASAAQVSDRDREVAAQLTAEIEAYFSGGLRTFAVPLDLGSERALVQRVSRELAAVGYGQTVTYGQLASLAGRPGAARAVGSVMANNRWPLLVPCHRVVPASGGPGHYAGGSETKAFLLMLEAQAAP
jgi:methylated-DNA-[protein]-cysteine S-methyltransferase